VGRDDEVERCRSSNRVDEGSIVPDEIDLGDFANFVVTNVPLGQRGVVGMIDLEDVSLGLAENWVMHAPISKPRCVVTSMHSSSLATRSTTRFSRFLQQRL
jgi:hypothetical protein